MIAPLCLSLSFSSNIGQCLVDYAPPPPPAPPSQASLPRVLRPSFARQDLAQLLQGPEAQALASALAAAGTASALAKELAPQQDSDPAVGGGEDALGPGCPEPGPGPEAGKPGAEEGACGATAATKPDPAPALGRELPLPETTPVDSSPRPRPRPRDGGLPQLSPVAASLLRQRTATSTAPPSGPNFGPLPHPREGEPPPGHPGGTAGSSPPGERARAAPVASQCCDLGLRAGEGWCLAPGRARRVTNPPAPSWASATGPPETGDAPPDAAAAPSSARGDGDAAHPHPPPPALRRPSSGPGEQGRPATRLDGGRQAASIVFVTTDGRRLAPPVQLRAGQSLIDDEAFRRALLDAPVKSALDPAAGAPPASGGFLQAALRPTAPSPDSQGVLPGQSLSARKPSSATVSSTLVFVSSPGAGSGPGSEKPATKADDNGLDGGGGGSGSGVGSGGGGGGSGGGGCRLRELLGGAVRRMDAEQAGDVLDTLHDALPMPAQVASFSSLPETNPSFYGVESFDAH